MRIEETIYQGNNIRRRRSKEIPLNISLIDNLCIYQDILASGEEIIPAIERFIKTSKAIQLEVEGLTTSLDNHVRIKQIRDTTRYEILGLNFNYTFNLKDVCQVLVSKDELRLFFNNKEGVSIYNEKNEVESDRNEDGSLMQTPFPRDIWGDDFVEEIFEI